MLPFDVHSRASWNGHAGIYQKTFAKLCAGAAEHLLDAAAVGPGVRLLDVGTGPGTVGILAADRGAVVTAVDAEESMVAAAARHLPDVRLGTLPDLPFGDDTFDAAVANFVLNHVAEPEAALRGMRRVVRPGGSVTVTIWPAAAPVTQQLFGEAIAAAGVTPGPMPRLAPEHDFERTVTGFRSLLITAGLSEVGTTTLEWEHRVDPEIWWSGPAAGLGSAGHIITSQSAEAQTRIKQEYDRLAARYLGADGLLTLPATALLATGRA
jgi:SAM-dependent methyltransferase